MSSARPPAAAAPCCASSWRRPASRGIRTPDFHRPSISEWLTYFGLTAEPSVPEHELLKAVFRAAIAKGSLETGIFGLRLQRDSFDFFTEKLAVLHPGYPNDAERFQAAFGRTLFVHLTRRDKVEQAVSYVKAQQTGLWHAAPDGTELERLSPPQEPAYDPGEIRARFEEVTAHDRNWDEWFASEKIDPLRITYEELSKSPLADFEGNTGLSGVGTPGGRRRRTWRRETGGRYQSRLGGALPLGAQNRLSPTANGNFVRTADIRRSSYYL